MHNGYNKDVEVEKSQITKYYTNGKDGEKIVSGGLADEFPDDDAMQQVSGKFRDGKRTILKTLL